MLAFVAITAAAVLSGQGAVSLSLYAGQPVGNGGITLSPWGGGAIEESSGQVLAGSHSLLITTATFFQGGTLSFAAPVSLAPYVANPENLLQVSVYIVRPAAPTGGGGAMGGGTGGMAIGGGSGSTQPAPQAKQMENLRLVIRTTDGKMSEAYYPLGAAGRTAERWRRIGVPLSKIPGFARTNKEIASVSISGDAPAHFFFGELRVVTDQTPIQGELSNRELNLGRAQEVILWAVAEAGFSVVEYAWDFDDKDGIQDEAVSQVIVHRFRVPGEYTVTCTIRDVYGIKEPWRGTMKVTVNP